MLLRLVRPMKRPGSSIPHFVQRIPADVRSRARGVRLTVPVGDASIGLVISERAESVRFSLRTRDLTEAKIRQARAAAYLETVWRALRQSEATTLTNKQAHALAGRMYRAWADGEGREQTLAAQYVPATGEWVSANETPEEEEAAFASAARRMEALAESDDLAELERAFGPLAARLLLAEGIASIDAQSRRNVLLAFCAAFRDAAARRERNAQGDYSPDPKAERFPAWETSPQSGNNRGTNGNSNGSASLKGLVDDWWREAKVAGRKPSTHESYRNTMALFVAFLKHDNAARVTPDDVVRFKDHRLAQINPRSGKHISAKTVKDSDLAGLKTIFGWAVANRRLDSNPAKGITVPAGKRPRLRSKGFTDAEAAAILQAARDYKRGREEPQTFAAKRWVPWLCAYTGARLGEMAQLRKHDLRKEGEHWVIRITPAAGTVKTDEARDVVLHPHLVELGFCDFVANAPGGHLFLRPSKDGDVLGPLQGIKNRLTAFARAIVADPHVAPTHGWRHRFKTVGLEAEIAERVLDAIQGHAPRTVAGSYGEVTIKTIAAAIYKMPRIAVPSAAAET